ncbi:hypothetical protein BD309DRAFT_949818 [Dichomitus squalens]|nr:hypothetical protein BD309DRAFT_949818 [Dichomitus squalens]
MSTPPTCRPDSPRSAGDVPQPSQSFPSPARTVPHARTNENTIDRDPHLHSPSSLTQPRASNTPAGSPMRSAMICTESFSVSSPR